MAEAPEEKRAVAVVKKAKKPRKGKVVGLKPYKFCQTSVALTTSAWRKEKMPQADFHRWFITSYVEGQPWGKVEDYCASQELHKDGTIHMHIYLKFAERYQNADAARVFDRDGPDVLEPHPHFKSCRSPKGWLTYLQKDGDYVGTCAKQDKTDPYRNFIRRTADTEAGIAAAEFKALPEVDEKTLSRAPFGMDLTLTDKQRHYWIVGPPNCGKTTVTQKFFRGTRSAFMRADNELYPYEGYMHERFIICDDLFPTLKEILAVSNKWEIRTERFGRSRNSRAYWTTDQLRTMIVLTNRPPIYQNEPAFVARFRKIELPPGGFQALEFSA